MLLAHLPAESATVRAIDPKTAEVASWTRTDHLLASVYDRLGVLIWQNENQGRKKGEQPTPRPQPLPRPGVEPTKRTIGTPMPIDELRQRLPGIEKVPADVA